MKFTRGTITPTVGPKRVIATTTRMHTTMITITANLAMHAVTTARTTTAGMNTVMVMRTITLHTPVTRVATARLHKPRRAARQRPRRKARNARGIGSTTWIVRPKSG